MSSLQDFLNANPVDGLTEEVPISDRFKDKDGKHLKFKISVMDNVQYGEYRKKATRINAKQKNVDFDTALFINTVVINHTVDPNFKDAESIKKMGCLSPEDYLKKVLLPGEIDNLAKQIQELSGFKSMEDLVEEAKN